MTTRRVVRSVRAVRLTSLLAFLSAAILAVASPPADPSIRISVRAAAGGAPIGDAYIGLVPMDHSLARPAREIVARTGQAVFTIPPGTYGLTTAANGFHADLREARVVAGVDNEITVELNRAVMISGTVSDPEGNPIAGAHVTQAPAATAPLADMSELALQQVGRSMRAITDANGAWQLTASRSPLLIEANGWAPAWLAPRPAEAPPVDVVLKKGSSLSVTLDRTDPAISITAVPTGENKLGLPSRFQQIIWSREANYLSLDWRSLPAGDYKLVATWPDPLRFTAPVEVGRVSLVEGGAGSARVALPPSRPAATSHLTFLVPPRTDLSGLRAFVRASDGVKVARHSTTDALGGKVVYVDTAASQSEIHLTTKTVLMTVRADAPKRGLAALELTHVPRGEGKLRIVPDEGITLPSTATVAFSSCLHNEKVTLPVNVGNDGILSFPLVVPCRSLTVNFGSAGALGLTAAVRAGEEKWFGDHKLSASASAEVHAVYAGANAPDVVIKATVMRERQTVPVGEAIADAQGRAVLEGLPAGEVTFEARFPETQHAGTTTVTMEPGKRIVVDPLEIPEPASLTIAAAFDPAFKSENPDAKLFGLLLEREDTGRTRDNREADFREGIKDVTFGDLTPGWWRIVAMVAVEESAQPIEVERVELQAGDDRKVSARIKPLVFTGQVVSQNAGVAASVGIGDPPGPSSIRRDIRTTADGKFKVALPKSGAYTVTVRRASNDPIDIGPVAFDSASPFVRIELPEGALAIQVRKDDQPLGDAVVKATMRVDGADGRGPARLTRTVKTNAAGTVTLENLQAGAWTIEAREPRTGRMAEKVAMVPKSSRAETTIEIADGELLKGVIIDENGGLAAGASISCVFPAAGGTLRTIQADANDHGAFSIALPDPPPARLDCGVATASGAIGAFVTAPGENPELVLPQAAGRMTIVDWGERVIPDRFWLAAPDGRLFNLSWAAKKFGRAWSPLTIARMPAGPWKIVRADSAAALSAIAAGHARSLPAAAEVRLEEGKSTDIRIQDGPVARR